ncbi:MAG: hypoxanthine phosphoribosyltransferase [Desulfobacterales bacterium]|jgi:hypoxanthine phosphoribosyltransferase|nr:hypoxanthine phosphoribosyltransferase [Desulfobacteraceae bacterium]MDD3990515.1 hypoxanthine phosphoribosyltransferase [Desulfobacteraceae bacterium]MDY0312857.1 hypoxanthine phosphoribosyltransferase [Desulfobacterales bacterium]
MPELLPVLDQEAVEKLIDETAQRISRDYADGQLVVIGVLKGAFIFMADLVRRLTIPVVIDFVGTSSYGDQTVSSGHVGLTREIGMDLRGKDVLLVEDIVDTGQTLAFLVAHIRSLGARSVKICALLDKPARRQVKVEVAYRCYEAPDAFLVGYGLDFNECYRQLSGIYRLQFNTESTP